MGARLIELAAGLVDEIVIHVVPLTLGGGIRLFGADIDRVRLEWLLLGQSGNITDLRYRVLRERRPPWTAGVTPPLDPA